MKPKVQRTGPEKEGSTNIETVTLKVRKVMVSHSLRGNGPLYLGHS